MKTYKGEIKRLKDNEIFVFGSNLQGFHGAGAAGYASFGIPGNQWRKFNYDKKPVGWQGMWNAKGIGEGLQKGHKGWSYALPTVTKPGAKKSLSKKQIINNIKKLYNICQKNTNFNFLIAYSGNNPDKVSLNGYSAREMAEIFNQKPIPSNVIFEESFSKLIME